MGVCIPTWVLITAFMAQIGFPPCYISEPSFRTEDRLRFNQAFVFEAPKFRLKCSEDETFTEHRPRMSSGKLHQCLILYGCIPRSGRNQTQRLLSWFGNDIISSSMTAEQTTSAGWTDTPASGRNAPKKLSFFSKVYM